MSLSPPVVVYPNQVTPTSSHSKGSFGPVFIVLAVIIVLSAFACCLSQLCARRMSHSKPRRDHQNNHPGGGDIEFGFKKKMPMGKPIGHGDIKEPRPLHNGEAKGEVKFADNA
ncbi:hypothetical protein FRX31_014754 [Thalictrum thalictroides]|uniref:C2H2-type domain-containing protein n=1 Tax=Thalictrum thalictroides TaxID=46969 RepID=A0A7J6WE03_THATH|nr:hypothetical protein FRX31_014754 [Thalictrum thalictroides]